MSSESANGELRYERLAQFVRDRRARFGLNQLEVGTLGGPSNSTLTQVEAGRPPRPSPSTLRKLDRGLGWTFGTARRILDPNLSDADLHLWMGKQEPDLGWVAEVSDMGKLGRPPTFSGGDTEVEIDADDLDPVMEAAAVRAERMQKAVSDFEAAASRLVQAENELNSQVRDWASREVHRVKMQEVIEDEEERVGRDLSEEERRMLLWDVTVTPADVAEFTAWAMQSDTREWTRYEMALVEWAFAPYYDGDPRVGSLFADIEPFRERVQRLGPNRDRLGPRGDPLRALTDAEPRAARRDPTGRRSKGQRARDAADLAGEESQDPGDEIEPR